MLNDQMRSEAEITNQNLSATSKRAKDAEEEVTQERDMRRVVSKELDDVREEHARTVVQLSQDRSLCCVMCCEITSSRQQRRCYCLLGKQRRLRVRP